MKQLEIETYYDKELKCATCKIIYDKDHNIYCTGSANCSPEDSNIASETIGITIAESRAMIKYLQFIKKYELQPKLNASLQLYYAINRSKQYNRKSYEAKMLYRQIQNYQEDISSIKEEINLLKAQLNDYIQSIDKFKEFKDKNK